MALVHYMDFNLLQIVFTTNRFNDTPVCIVIKMDLI